MKNTTWFNQNLERGMGHTCGGLIAWYVVSLIAVVILIN
jgi:hypothetical protein